MPRSSHSSHTSTTCAPKGAHLRLAIMLDTSIPRLDDATARTSPLNLERLPTASLHHSQRLRRPIPGIPMPPYGQAIVLNRQHRHRIFSRCIRGCPMTHTPPHPTVATATSSPSPATISAPASPPLPPISCYEAPCPMPAVSATISSSLTAQPLTLSSPASDSTPNSLLEAIKHLFDYLSDPDHNPGTVQIVQISQASPTLNH